VTQNFDYAQLTVELTGVVERGCWNVLIDIEDLASLYPWLLIKKMEEE